MYNVVELRAYRILYNVTKLIYAKEKLVVNNLFVQFKKCHESI